MGYRMCRRYDNAEQIYLRSESYSITGPRRIAS